MRIIDSVVNLAFESSPNVNSIDLNRHFQQKTQD